MNAPETAPLPSALPAWDPDAAMLVLGADLAVARSLLDQLRAELPDDLARMRTHAAAGALDALADAAHHLTGGAAYCGVPALVAALHRLERAARAGEHGGSDAALVAVEDEIARLLGLAVHG